MADPKPKRGVKASAPLRLWEPDEHTRETIAGYCRKTMPDDFWEVLSRTVGEAWTRETLFADGPKDSEIGAALNELEEKAMELWRILMDLDDYTRIAMRLTGRDDPIEPALAPLAELVRTARGAAVRHKEAHKKGGRPRGQSTAKQYDRVLRPLLRRYGIRGHKADAVIETILPTLW